MTEVYKFDEVKHAHFINGKRVPGVTTISGSIDDGKSGALMGWAAKLTAAYVVDNLVMKDGAVFVGGMELTPDTAGKVLGVAKKAYKESRDAAGDLGTRVHTLCEKYWTEDELLIQQDEAPAFATWKEWVEDYSVEAVSTEQHIYSLKNLYGGILDLIATLNGVRYLVDIKTSNRISPGYFIQLGGYLLAYEEMTGEKIENAGIIRLDKAGEGYEWCDLSGDLEETRSDFLGALRIYNNLKKYRKTINKAVKKERVDA